jgi:nicotinamide mononucleotide transporter
MSENLGQWLTANYIEILGALFGLTYIVLSIRQNILTWPAGLISSILYVGVFLHSKFYAGMVLQVYYVGISFYGWYFWLKGNRKDKQGEVPVSKIKKNEAILTALITPFIFALIFLILFRFTDSPVPFLDALSTSLGIVATLMLARKILENWLLWIVADLVSTGLYIYKGLWPTTVLFLVYTALAILGYFQWKRSLMMKNL